MIDKLSLLISGGLTGTAIVTFIGLIVRANPSLYLWAYIIAGVVAIAFGILLATKQPQIVMWVGIICFFGLLGVILAGI